MSQAKPHALRPPSPTSQSICGFWWRVFHVVEQDPPNKYATATRHGKSPLLGERAGWSAVWYNSITGWYFSAQFKMKVDSDVLLISYLDKICLILAGDLWRALACLYSEARLYKGPREVTRPQLTTLHSIDNTSVWTKEVGHSNTSGTVRLCSFPLKFTAAQ